MFNHSHGTSAVHRRVAASRRPGRGRRGLRRVRLPRHPGVGGRDGGRDLPAYVFRLFPTKRDLFVAAQRVCFDRIIDAMRAAVEDLPAAAPSSAAPSAAPSAASASAPSSSDPASVLAAMAEAYAALIADHKLLMLQVHALAATDEPEIRRALRDEHARLVRYVAERSGADRPAVREFYARGQLCQLVAALGLGSADGDGEWAAYLTEGLVHYPRTPAD
ncbi:hypothetical protein NKH77_25505 [Streptomyces sp. M19]